ncbi:unnamed protein product [Linum trigynum]|uniref:Uncharacterized protein n=1 Tax=Linum trigynum TaxID=586398 RepID=A0AAV2DYD0_9ROSI
MHHASLMGRLASNSPWGSYAHVIVEGEPRASTEGRLGGSSRIAQSESTLGDSTADSSSPEGGARKTMDRLVLRSNEDVVLTSILLAAVPFTPTLVDQFLNEESALLINLNFSWVLVSVGFYIDMLAL